MSFDDGFTSLDYARENAPATACDACSHDVDPEDCRKTLDGKWTYCPDCASKLHLVECVSCDRWVALADATYDVDFDLFDCPECFEKEQQRAWERKQERLMEDGGGDDSAYRRQMKDAGRGHLLG